MAGGVAIECGWGCTPGKPSRVTVATRASRCIGLRASAPPATGVRFSFRRPRRPCSRTRRRSCTSLSSISVTSGSRTSTGPCACTRRPRTGSEATSLPFEGWRRSRAPRSNRGPFWRSRAALAVALVAFLAVAVAGLLATRDSGGGLDLVQPQPCGDHRRGEQRDRGGDPGGHRPGPIAAGAGAVWVGNGPDRTLTKVDPATRTATATIPLENRTPTGIAVGLGSVWVAHGLLGQVSQIEPQFGQVSRTISVAGTAFGSPLGSVALDERTAWVTFGDSTFARLDPAGEFWARRWPETSPPASSSPMHPSG